MSTSAMIEMFERVMTPLTSPSVEELQQAVADATRLESMLGAVKTGLMVELTALTPVGQDAYAKAANVSLSQSDRVVKRARVLSSVPALADAFAAGELSAAHVDVVVAAYRSVKPAVREDLAALADELVAFGKTSTAEALRERVAGHIRRVEDTGDAEERLIQQKRATRFKWWVDPDSKMGRIAGWFDPESFLQLRNRIINETEARFHGLTPEHCPDDPLERQQFLRAHALLGLVTGNAVSAAGGTAEVVVVHHREGHEPEIDWGVAGLELPNSALDRILAGRARVFNIVVRNGDIHSAPGDLNLGRTVRLANRAQRRALAAVHKTCCYPGCDVGYWQTKLHHLKYWRNGGLTDLANLVPICTAHHAKVHAENIALRLLPGRQVEFTHQNGHTHHSTGPP